MTDKPALTNQDAGGKAEHIKFLYRNDLTTGKIF